MLNFYLNKIDLKNVVLFADNCFGQNKNNALIHYHFWRVMTNKNENVSINFLFTGHTKFSPDRNFGIIKFKFAKQNVDCHNDLIQLMNESSQNGFNVAIQSKDPITKIRDIKWASWDSFMKQYSKPIPGITKYHHFTTCKSGEIKAQLIVDSPIKIIHNQMELGSGKRIVPLQLIEPEGLTLKRC